MRLKKACQLALSLSLILGIMQSLSALITQSVYRLLSVSIAMHIIHLNPLKLANSLQSKPL